MSYEVLRKYLPNDLALKYIEHWTAPYSMQLKVSKSRKGKLGDYRKINSTYKHKITINHNLVPELFFLTLTHEIAHMMVYDQILLKKVKPHGKEWKNIFGKLILESLEVYSPELRKNLIPFARNPKAGYYGDSALVEYFNRIENPEKLMLLQLKEGSRFSIENNEYQLLEKRRTRYLCKNLKNHKNYLIHRSVNIKIA